MALYLGNEKVKLNLNYRTYYLNLNTGTIIVNGVLLASVDDYILKDSNGLYLTVKEEI